MAFVDPGILNLARMIHSHIMGLGPNPRRRMPPVGGPQPPVQVGPQPTPIGQPPQFLPPAQRVPPTGLVPPTMQPVDQPAVQVNPYARPLPVRGPMPAVRA